MRNKIVDMYQSGKGYKAISSALALQRTTVRAIIHKWRKRITIINLEQCTLKNAGLKPTQLWLFGNPALGKYWTEHMLGYFDPDGWVKSFYPPCWVV